MVADCALTASEGDEGNGGGELVGGRGQRGVAARARAVEVHVEPAVVAPVPDASLLGLWAVSHALSETKTTMHTPFQTAS